LVFGDEKTKVTRRNETMIGGFTVVRTDSYSFRSKVMFVSWNKATGKWLSWARFSEKSPERRPFVSGVYFGTRIVEPAMTDDAAQAVDFKRPDVALDLVSETKLDAVELVMRFDDCGFDVPLTIVSPGK